MLTFPGILGVGGNDNSVLSRGVPNFPRGCTMSQESYLEWDSMTPDCCQVKTSLRLSAVTEGFSSSMENLPLFHATILKPEL